MVSSKVAPRLGRHYRYEFIVARTEKLVARCARGGRSFSYILIMPAVTPTCARRRAPPLRQDSLQSTSHDDERPEGISSAQTGAPLQRQLSDGPVLRAPMLRAGSSTSSQGSHSSLFGAARGRDSQLPDIASESDDYAGGSSGHESSDHDDVDKDEGETGPLLSGQRGGGGHTSLTVLQRRWQAERRERQQRQNAARAGVARVPYEQRDIYGRRRVCRPAGFEDEGEDPSDATEVDLGSVCACCIIICAAFVWLVGGVGLILGSTLYLSNKTMAEAWEELQHTRAANLGVDVSQL